MCLQKITIDVQAILKVLRLSLIALALQRCSPEFKQLKPVSAHSKSMAVDSICPQLCDSFETCAGKPHQCQNVCQTHLQQQLKTEFVMSFTQCVQRELEHCAVLSSRRSEIQKEKIDLCYGATLKAYASVDQGENTKKIITALCQRQARCLAEPNETSVCTQTIQSSLQPASKAIFSSIRDEVISTMIHCIEASDCSHTSWQRCLPKNLSTLYAQ